MNAEGQDALTRLALSTAEAVSGVLEMFAPGQVTVGEVAVVPGDRDPLDGIAAPAVATSVAYVDGVTGGNIFVMTVDGARRLAAAMVGTDPAAVEPAGDLDEMELSAVGEAMNQMMASAAAATSGVLGTSVEISVPESRRFTAATEAIDAYPRAPHATRVAFSVCGEPCRLVQLVPNAFVVRLAGALDEMGAEPVEEPGHADDPTGVRPSLSGIPVRVWAELGRAEMASAQVVGLPAGAVVELDRGADDAIDLYVNGKRFAAGRLHIVEGDWAVLIEHVFSPIPHPDRESEVS